MRDDAHALRTADPQRIARPASVTSTPATTAMKKTTPWRTSYQRRLFFSDFIALVWVVFGTQITWFGFGDAAVIISEDHRFNVVSYWVFSALLIVLWMSALALGDTRSHRIIGTGATEYVRVADASVRLFGLIAIVAFLGQISLARGFLLISLPLGVVVLLLERWLWRQWLVAKRSQGGYSARVLLVGSESSVARIARELARAPSAGYQVVGACLPEGRHLEAVPGTDIPVFGNVDTIDRALAATNADTVAITSTDELPPDKVKQISWSLETGQQHLVLAPSITDVAGPRLHTRPVSGLPLIHVETPRYSAGQRLLKRTFDIFVALVCIIVTSPLLIVIAAIVKWTSPGPVLYRSERIGQHGAPFHMLKFRSMRQDADKELAALLLAQGTSTQPLFKVKNDPRITRVGRFIRKYSIDELPQLFNVIGGSMSLVGPRPQISAEVALYTDSAHRRLLAKPGITGLWQVSGRSDVGWDEAVRLDLYYVENWTLLNDIVIIFKTVKAVLIPGETAR